MVIYGKIIKIMFKRNILKMDGNIKILVLLRVLLLEVINIFMMRNRKWKISAINLYFCQYLDQ